MPGQAIVTIGEKQWAVSVATTLAELSSGLSNVASIPASTGILFVMGYDRSSISVNMSEMLFALDIVFINSTAGVVGVLHDVQPGDDAVFQADTTLGAGYFLEVNAGEAEGIEVGDSVDLGSASPTTNGIDIDSIMNLMITMMIVVMMMKMMTGAMGGALEPAPERPLIYGPRGEVLSQSSSRKAKRLGNPGPGSKEKITVRCPICGEAVKVEGYNRTGRSDALLKHIQQQHPVSSHSIYGPERQHLVDQYGTWAVGRAESVCSENDVKCVRKEAGRLLRAYRREVNR